MHRIEEDGVEKNISFDDWQSMTKIHYENDSKSTAGETPTFPIMD
jgi:hypothetical protein